MRKLGLLTLALVVVLAGCGATEKRYDTETLSTLIRAGEVHLVGQCHGHALRYAQCTIQWRGGSQERVLVRAAEDSRAER